ncbi:MAG TPA: DMT family transporter [Polyangiaceae bacterium]
MTSPAESPERSPFVAGGLLALLSAAAFGASAPLVQRFGHDVGPFTTAALLYVGAALASVSLRRSGDAPLRGGALGRVAVVALLGAVVAPVCLAWGLQRTSGVTAALLLNLEALFTVLLAWAIWREPIGPRVGLAALAMASGGALLVVDGRILSAAAGWGALAVVAATVAWAADNVVGRPLADRDPARVVRAKGSMGAVVSLLLARATGEPWPAWTALALVVCGAVGYGFSLRLYLRAQRTLGAARTGSVFAAAPFLGAVLAWTLGERAAGLPTLAAGALCAFGVALHLTETHGHAHTHAPEEHEHPHRHDDGHHTHTHDVLPEGEHSHPHRHDPVSHAHPHGPDLHHRHEH